MELKHQTKSPTWPAVQAKTAVRCEVSTVTDLVQNLDEMNCVKSKDSKKYEWAATGCGVRIKLKN